MTDERTREEILEDIAVSVEHETLDRKRLRTLMRGDRKQDDAAFSEVASEILARAGGFIAELDSVRQTKSRHEIMVEVLKTHVVVAHKHYPCERENRRVECRVRDLRAHRAYLAKSYKKEMVSA